MKIFLDTNVVVDYLAHRAGFYEDAALIVEMISRHLVEASVSALTLVNCAYVMRKFFDKAIVIDKIRAFMGFVNVLPIDEGVLNEALSSDGKDFEDAVQFFSAMDFNPDVIITRDRTGFSMFSTMVMTPKSFIEACCK